MIKSCKNQLKTNWNERAVMANDEKPRLVRPKYYEVYIDVLIPFLEWQTILDHSSDMSIL